MSFQNSERPLLKGYTTGFVNGGQKRHLMILGQGSYGLCLTGNIMFNVTIVKLEFIVYLVIYWYLVYLLAQH